jgi:putative transposase
LAPFFCCKNKPQWPRFSTMPRGNRLRGEGGVFHVTHRCHDRSFLLKFARDRNVYRSLLREHLQQFDIALLDYCITSNHVHLLLDTPEREEISFMMREVAGEFARYYNRRKLRTNAFWGDNFHTTLVEGGDYLWRCLCYIELNMVRCGTVSHPQEWQWVGWHEITGRRSRYRLLDLDQLCWRLRIHTLGDLRKNLKFALEEAIARGDLKRERFWTESIAVGSAEFVKSGASDSISSGAAMRSNAGQRMGAP